MFKGVGGNINAALAPTIPLALFAIFQMKFAIITPALITGSFAGRVRFSSYILFISLFSIFIYAPLAHWTWHPNGFLRNWGVLDFAGEPWFTCLQGLQHCQARCFLAQEGIISNSFIPPIFLLFYWEPVCYGLVGSVSMQDRHSLPTR